MASLYISEYKGVAKGTKGIGAQAAQEPSLATQKVSFTTAAQSAAFNRETTFVRLIASANVWLAFGANPTATVASAFLPANTVEYFGVVAGQKVSAYDGAS